MVKSKSFKPSSKGGGGGIDRISNLPEPLISHILSLLPTKCAVATSVLSTTWKFLWTDLTNLDIYINLEDEYYLSKKEGKFTPFLNSMLCLVNPPFIRNFCLIYEDNLDSESEYPSCLHASWFSFALRRTVGELDIFVNWELLIELPPSHTHYNMAVLKLDGCIYFNILAAASICFPNLHTLKLEVITLEIASGSSVSFPNLKIMHLKRVHYANEESLNKLLSSCPVLVDLVIEREDWDNVHRLIIRIPSLTSLKLYICYSVDYPYKFQIDTPALQYLDIKDEFPCEYFLAETLCSLLEAKLKLILSDEDGVYVERCASIFKCIGSNSSTVKFLSVSSQVLKAIITAAASISPGFQNLTRLELEDENCLDSSVVINFLESTENLEHLVIKDRSYEHSHQSWWAEPLNVPKCLLLRVTTISFTFMIDYCYDQLELLRYFMKKGEVLQLLTISTAGGSKTEQLELLEKLSIVPWGSRKCQLTIT